jgi:TctA family transporter
LSSSNCIPALGGWEGYAPNKIWRDLSGRHALLISGGDLLVLFQPPIVLPIMVAAGLIFFWPTISGMIKKRRRKVGPG